MISKQKRQYIFESKTVSNYGTVVTNTPAVVATLQTAYELIKANIIPELKLCIETPITDAELKYKLADGETIHGDNDVLFRLIEVPQYILNN